MQQFEGKVVLITGAGRGLGRALAQAFSLQGARVAANDLTPVNLDGTIASLKAKLPAKKNADVQEYVADVSQKMAVQGMILQILDRWNRLDIVINNAAVHPKAPLLDIDEWDWRRTLDVNLTGAFFVTQVAARVMREQGGGVILNIGEAIDFYPGEIPLAAYQATKQALLALTLQAANELKPYGIRVNALTCGLLEGDAFYEMYPDYAQREKLLKDGKVQMPQHVAQQALFLCDPEQHQLSGKIWQIGTDESLHT